MTQQLPAYLQKSAAPNLVQVAQQALGGINPPYLSIKGGRFTLVDQGGNELQVPTFDPTVGVYVDCCIIDMNKHKSRIFYENDFDPTASAYLPPECWSDNGTGPSVTCSKPQAPTCATCQWSVWGSATSAQGKPIPACQEVAKIAIMIPGLGPQVDNMIFLLRVPPASLKNFRTYTASFSGQGVNIPDVLTRVYFDRTTQGVLLFAPAPASAGMPLPYIGEHTYALRETAYIEKKTDLLVGHLDVARNPVLPTIQAPAQLAAPQPQIQQAAPNAPAGSVGTQNPMSAVSSFGTTPVSPQSPPAEQPQQQTRRRRRTQAEIQAANAATGQPVSPPAAQPQSNGFGQSPPATPMAPFPVSPPPASTPAQPNTFGMAQPAPANPQMQEMLAGLGFKPPGT